MYLKFPGGSDGKESARNVGDQGSIPGTGRSPGEGNGNPLQYSCMENPMDGGPWLATVQGVAKSQTRLMCTWAGHLIFDKGGKNIQWIKDNLFNKWCWKSGQPLVKE